MLTVERPHSKFVATLQCRHARLKMREVRMADEGAYECSIVPLDDRGRRMKALVSWVFLSVLRK